MVQRRRHDLPSSISRPPRNIRAAAPREILGFEGRPAAGPRPAPNEITASASSSGFPRRYSTPSAPPSAPRAPDFSTPEPLPAPPPPPPFTAGELSCSSVGWKWATYHDRVGKSCPSVLALLFGVREDDGARENHRKRSSSLDVWSHRYRLVPTRSGPALEDALGAAVPLARVTAVRSSEPCGFDLEFDGRDPISFAARDAGDRDGWVAALARAVREGRRQLGAE